MLCPLRERLRRAHCPPRSHLDSMLTLAGAGQPYLPLPSPAEMEEG